MHRRLQRLPVSLAILLCLAPIAPGAQAETTAFVDGSDTRRGGIEIKRVAHVRTGEAYLHTLIIAGGLDPEDLDAEHYVGVALNLDNDKKIERTLFAIPRGGKFDAVMVREDGSYRNIRAVRVTGGLRFVVDRDFIPGIPGYRWFAFARSGEIWDYAPNAKWLIHDFTPPEITNLNPYPDGVVTIPEEEAFRYFKGIEERGYSGLAGWAVYTRANDDDPWIQAASGGQAPIDTLVPATAGSVTEACSIAWDKAGNRSQSGVDLITTADDDDDAAFSFDENWTTVVDDDAYGGSVHVSTQAGATFAYTMPRAGNAWIVSDLPYHEARVEIALDDVRQFPDVLIGGLAPREPQSLPVTWMDFGPGPGSHVITGTVTSGTAKIDGIGVSPVTIGPPTFTPCFQGEAVALPDAVRAQLASDEPETLLPEIGSPPARR